MIIATAKSLDLDIRTPFQRARDRGSLHTVDLHTSAEGCPYELLAIHRDGLCRSTMPDGILACFSTAHL